MMHRNLHRLLTMIAGLVVLLGGAGCSSQPPAGLGVQADGRLRLCPDRPNCVSSYDSADDKAHYIEPFVGGAAAWSSLTHVIGAQSSLTIVARQEYYLRAEATTRVLRFVDDLEFLFQPAQGLIHVRSASRVGYSDFGVNRERLERIRQQLRHP
ncbi:DUF1499 domain-containing protein [Marinobacter mobilis]|uniref:Uncharacterized conserved protein, DUF1499 family n=1 Tax=Marinobacter mobilis TaxID=488533 RepID=A0A1H2SPB0_9GAMM|nr:DUF1499 domain-containing protein [Marinobacter mobilis]SDW33481.1 Uncharacterized conserved protein, DUF1499 family [Marinobacter mobilis]